MLLLSILVYQLSTSLLQNRLNHIFACFFSKPFKNPTISASKKTNRRFQHLTFPLPQKNAKTQIPMAMALSDRVREAFKSWDTQGDGTITKRGMQLGPQGSRVTETPKAETSPRESQRFFGLEGCRFRQRGCIGYKGIRKCDLLRKKEVG